MSYDVPKISKHGYPRPRKNEGRLAPSSDSGFFAHTPRLHPLFFRYDSIVIVPLCPRKQPEEKRKGKIRARVVLVVRGENLWRHKKYV
jgi:hypothetical protein